MFKDKKSLEEKVVQPCKTDDDDINSGARLMIKKRKKSAVVPKINLADFFIDNSNDRLNIESKKFSTLNYFQILSQFNEFYLLEKKIKIDLFVCTAS